MRKTIVLLLALVMILSLCACGGTAETVETTSAQTTSTQTEPTVPAETELEETEPEGLTAEPVQIGDTISSDYAVLTLDALEISDGYEFEYVEKGSSGITITHGSSIDCPSDMKLVCLKGKFTNKAKSEIYPGNNPAYGKIIINGYEYKTRMVCYNVAEADPISNVVPLREVDYFLYAEVPKTLTAGIETCEFYIGFAKDLNSSFWIKDVSDCSALYLLDTIPTVK